MGMVVWEWTLYLCPLFLIPDYGQEKCISLVNLQSDQVLKKLESLVTTGQ